RGAAGRDDAVVHLQHVQGRREIEDVDEQAEPRRRDKMLTAVGERLGEDARQLDPSELHWRSPDAAMRCRPRVRCVKTMKSPTRETNATFGAVFQNPDMCIRINVIY